MEQSVATQNSQAGGPRVRKQASMLLDCFNILLPSQSHGQAVEGKNKDAVTGRSGSCSGVHRTRQASKPPASHPAGLQ